MSKFIGDRVKFNKKYDNSDAVPYGAIGTVTELEVGLVKVLFDGIGERACDEESLVLLKEENKMGNTEREDGRGLYEVVVVNPNEDGEVLLVEKVVAKDEGEAKFISNVKEIVKKAGLKIGAVDIIVNHLGSVRPYETAQKIKVVGSVDGYTLVKKEK